MIVAGAQEWRVACTCIDGVFVGAVTLAGDDDSEPADALRAERIDAVVLEAARGGAGRPPE